MAGPGVNPPYFDTVLTGAGVSLAPPSSLPSGDQLARLLWLLVAGSGPHHCSDTVIDTVAQDTAAGSGLRLEEMAETLSGVLDSTLIACVYEVVANAKPNTAHLALAALGVRTLLTVNVDKLHETAGQPAIHLHGICDDPTSIITTIGGYLKGLPQSTTDSLRQAVAGRRVTTLGYSGRDRDVLPLLVSFNPAALDFGVFASASLTDDVREELSHMDPSLLVETAGDATTRLCAIANAQGVNIPLAHASTSTVDYNMVRPHDVFSPGTLTQFSRITPRERSQAIALVLFRLGRSADTLAVYRQIEADGMGGPAISKGISRTLHSVGGSLNEAKAIHEIATSFRRVRSLGSLREAAFCLNELCARYRSFGNIPAALFVNRLDYLLLRTRRLFTRSDHKMDRRLRSCRVTLGMIMNSMGHPKSALLILESVITQAEQNGEPKNLMAASLWAADALKTLGGLPEAQKRLTKAAQLEEYDVQANKDWVIWKRAEIAILMDEDNQAENQIASLLSAGVRPDQEYWYDMTLADAARDHSTTACRNFLRNSQMALDRCCAGDNNPGRRYVAARVLLLLHQAECERLDLRPAQCQSHLTSASRLLRNRKTAPFGNPVVTAIAATIRAEMVCAYDLTSGVPLLRRALRMNRDAGARYGALRAAISLQEATGQADPTIPALLTITGDKRAARRIGQGRNALSFPNHFDFS